MPIMPGSPSSIDVDAARRAVRMAGREVPVGGRAFDVLRVLHERRGEVVSRRDLLAQAWPGQVVDANNLAVQIAALRRALGGSTICTIPGRGYQLVDSPTQDHMAAEAPGSPAAAAAAGVTQAPARVLYGRDAELAMVQQALEHGRLVTVLGSGGIGKTSLARALMARWDQRGEADGTCRTAWAVMEGIGSLPQACGAVALACGLALRGEDPLSDLVATLGGRHLLLVVDGAEHLLDELSALSKAVLEGTDRVRLLVTSQAPLRLAAEQLVRLQGLAVPGLGEDPAAAIRSPAAQLFTARAREADWHFEPGSQDMAAVAELCRRLEGHPLAIELAAARVPMLSVPDLLRLLEDAPLRLLAAPRRDAVARHQGLRLTLQWSHDLLTPEQRETFRRLALFEGPCSLELAQRMLVAPGEDAWDVMDRLSELVDRALVDTDGGDVPRLHMLQPARRFALECLERAGEAPLWRERHARAVLQHCLELWAQKKTGQRTSDSLRRELVDHLVDARAALATLRLADPAGAVELASLLATYFHNVLFDECRAMTVEMEGLVDGAPDAVQAGWHLQQAQMWFSRDMRRAYPAAQRARELYARAGDRTNELFALAAFAVCRARSGLPAAAELAQIEVLSATCSLPEHERPGFLAWCAGVAIYENRNELAREMTIEARRLAAVNGHSQVEITATINLIDIELALGRPQQAVELALALLERFERSALSIGTVHVVRLNLALAHLDLAQPELAQAVALDGWPRAIELGQAYVWSEVMADLAAQQDRMPQAAQMLGYSDESRASCGMVRERNELRATARAEALARSALGNERFEALRSTGRTLSTEAAGNLVLGHAVQESRAPGRGA